MKIIALLLLSSSVLLGLSGSTVWEVRVAGSDTNGGAFVTGASGTDMSQFNNANSAGCSSCQSASANISTTDLVTAGTTTIVSATAAFTSAIVGNVVYITGGTGAVAASWYQVVTYTNATTVVVDRSTGLTAGTGATINIGGALKTYGQLCGTVNATGGTNGTATAYFLNAGSVFSVTSASGNVANGTCQITPQNFVLTEIGYVSSRTAGNTDTSPTIQANVTSATMYTTGTNQGITVPLNIAFDGNAQTGTKFLNLNNFTGWNGRSDTIKNFASASVFTGNNASACLFCTITGNSVSVLAGAGMILEYSVIYSNTATAVTSTSAQYILTFNNTGGSTDGIVVNGTADHITSVGNGRHGINSGSGTVQNSILQSNGGYGVNGSALSFTNACYLNTSGCIQTGYSSGTITLSGDAFTNTAGNVYSLNNLAGQGASCRAIALPLAYAATPDFQDLGASQHQDPFVIFSRVE